MSCTRGPEAFRCGSSDQCSGGICQPSGYCSFPDPTCSSSGQRYGNLAGEGLANTCVFVDVADDSSDDDSDSSDSDSLGETTDSGSTTSSVSTAGPTGPTGGSQTDSTTHSTSVSTSSTSQSNASDSESSSTTAEGDSDSTTGGDSTTAAETSVGTTESASSSETSTEPVLNCTPDEFDGTTLGSLWSAGGELPRANAAVADGQLQLTVDPTLEGSNNIVVSTRTANRYGGSAELELGTVDTSTYGGVQLVFGMGSGYEFIEFQRIAFDIVARYRIDETSPEELWREEYIPELHRFLALRVEGTADDATLIWETSGNGTSWDTRATLPRPADQLDMSAALVQILAGTFEASEELTELDPFTIERYEQCRLIH